MTIVPTFGVSDHRAPRFMVPCTDAVNCADWPAVSAAGPGAIEMLTLERGGIETEGVNTTMAVAVTVGSARLVAVIESGAV